MAVIEETIETNYDKFSGQIDVIFFADTEEEARETLRRLTTLVFEDEDVVQTYSELIANAD